MRKMIGKLVVIGGCAAGMSAASAARRIDPELEIVVFESSCFVSYGSCGLPYYITSHPSIFAAGDCVQVRNLVTNRPDYIPLGITANKQGRVAGTK